MSHSLIARRAEQRVALDRAGIAPIRDVTFLAAGPASELNRSAAEVALMVEAGGSDKNETGGQPISWPWYVRWLAVAYVLSLAAGPVGFFVLAGVAAFRIARHGLDGGAAWAVAAAVACPLACAAFRAWFRNWGRRRWPDGRVARAK